METYEQLQLFMTPEEITDRYEPGECGWPTTDGVVNLDLNTREVTHGQGRVITSYFTDPDTFLPVTYTG
jgi:hypothetical protein